MCTLYLLILLFEEDAVPFFSGATTTSGRCRNSWSLQQYLKNYQIGLYLHILHHVSPKVRVQQQLALPPLGLQFQRPSYQTLVWCSETDFLRYSLKKR